MIQKSPMAETRSKTAKKRNDSSSFISNLAKKFKKVTKRSPEDEPQGHLPYNKKWKPPEKIQTKTRNLNVHSQPVQSNPTENEFEANHVNDNVKDVASLLEEEPIYFDLSDEDTEIPNKSNGSKGKDNYCANNERGIFLKESDDAENPCISESKETEKLEIANKSKVVLVEDKKINDREKEIIFDKTDVVPSDHETQTLNPMNSNVPLDLSGSSVEKKLDYVPQNINTGCSVDKILLKNYKDLVKVVEDIKHINVLVKKIQEEFERCSKQ